MRVSPTIIVCTFGVQISSFEPNVDLFRGPICFYRMDICFLALSRYAVVCSREEKTWAATATRQNLCDSRDMADLHGRYSYLEVETESRLSCWYDISKWSQTCLTSKSPQPKKRELNLAGFFFLSDALNTTVVIIGTLQGEVQEYNTIEICELYMVLFATEAAGILAFMYIQRRWNLTTKIMLNTCAVNIIAINIYGMVGIWTETIGFHHGWEFWMWNAWYGFMICPWYSYSQTMVRFPRPYHLVEVNVLLRFHHHLYSQRN